MRALATVLALVGAAQGAAAEPMDLARSGSRWVAVQVVTSAAGEEPLTLSPPARGWLQARPGSRRRTVTIPGRAVERRFFGAHRPVAGSFSDFVWVFHADTGHVVSASVSGRVNEIVRLGPFEASVQVAIIAWLSSAASGGYGPVRLVAGRPLRPWCADPQLPGCTRVAAAAYDPRTGRVRALGPVCASWRTRRTQAFSWLGHARFREEPQRAEAPEARPALRRTTADATPRGGQC